MRLWFELLCFYNKKILGKETVINKNKLKSSKKMSLGRILPFHRSLRQHDINLLPQINLDRVQYRTLNFAVTSSDVVFYITLKQVKTQLVEMDGVGRLWLLFATLIVPLLSLGE